MNCNGPYRVVLLCRDGYTVSDNEEDTLARAKERARYLLSDDYAWMCETTHDRLLTLKAEVLDRDGMVVWDAFRRGGA